MRFDSSKFYDKNNKLIRTESYIINKEKLPVGSSAAYTWSQVRPPPISTVPHEEWT